MGDRQGALSQPKDGPYRDGVQPLDRLLPSIRRAHPGEFYDAEGPTYGPSGDAHYHLKWMTPEGRVIWFDADARNGRVLRSSARQGQLTTTMTVSGGRDPMARAPLSTAIRLTPPIPMMAVMAVNARANATITARLPAMPGPIAIGVPGVAATAATIAAMAVAAQLA